MDKKWALERPDPDFERGRCSIPDKILEFGGGWTGLGGFVADTVPGFGTRPFGEMSWVLISG